MADDGFDLRISGLDELRAQLQALPGKLRKRALLNALRAGARVIRDEARRATPVLAAPVRRKGIIVRQPGTVRRAISVRTSKIARRMGDVGVFVNVKPGKVKGGARGRNNPADPFYWRWLEFGARGRPGARMLQRAIGKAADALRRFESALAPAVEKLNNRGQEP